MPNVFLDDRVTPGLVGEVEDLHTPHKLGSTSPIALAAEPHTLLYMVCAHNG